MSSDLHQRELLLCAVARQQQLLDDAALESAVRAWLVAPERPLAEVFAERAQLSASQVAKLNATADRHAAESHSDATSARLRALPSVVEQLLTETARPVTTLRRPFDTLPQDPARRAEARAEATQQTPGDRFEIIQVHAQGGLGVVFLARDREIDRTVALKQVKSKWADDEDARARFLLEARVTGRLEHPGVAPVYALGTDDTGRPYYAMRLIRGESLLEVIERFHHGRGAGDRAHRLPELRKLLTRFLEVCNAVDYAHSKGVIHRDLKPANIMVGKFGETLVVDWGLAKVIGSDEDVALTTRMAPGLPGNSDATETRLGTAIGTPAYMSPEQAAGRINELGPPTDVYSLGATLYQLLTGWLPHGEEEEIDATLAKVAEARILSPRERAPWLPRPLESICMKALAPTPPGRYLSARALSDDLQRWLADEPVTAHREGLTERVFRWARNHRTLATALAVGYLVATAAIVAGVIGWNYVQVREREAQPAAESTAE